MEQEPDTEKDSSISDRFTIYLAAAGAGTILYSLTAFIQENAYTAPNKFYKLFQALGEPTYLTSAPLVYLASICCNIPLVLAESFCSKHETVASILHYSQYFLPLTVVLVYSLVEFRFGGITTPDIGPDTLWGDIVSGLVGGVLAALTVRLVDQSIKRSKSLIRINN